MTYDLKAQLQKQKEIEEIRDILIDAIAPEIVLHGTMSFLTRSYQSRILVDFNKLALAIYNAGYRKGENTNVEN